MRASLEVFFPTLQLLYVISNLYSLGERLSVVRFIAGKYSVLRITHSSTR